MPDGPVRKVTIFVSSPTDVMAERERAARAIDRLQSRFREHVKLEPIFFEDSEKFYTADKSFQEQIPDAGAADLVVSIFWSRVGSELPPDIFGTMPDGKPYPGGAIYELMRALEAKRRRNVPDILVYRKVADTLISVTDPQKRSLMLAQLCTFEAFWRQWFVSQEGHFRAGYQTFKTPDEFEHLLEGHLRAWLGERGLLGREVVWRIAERGSPFRSLEPYEAQHAEVFFGREREIDRGREHLLAAAARGSAFLLIVGPSGSGKSSLARAGLATRLTLAGDIEGVDLLRVAVLRPGDAATPQLALARALFQPDALPELSESDFPTPEGLASVLTSEAGAASAPILRSLERAAASLKAEKSYDRPVETRLLLILDQLEDLFSASLGDGVRKSFVRLIAALARSGRVLVIATLRSSSYGVLAHESELMALKEAGATLDVAVPGPEVLAEIVRRPAAAAGLTFERRGDDGLDEVLLTAAGGNADALPLLGFTLQSLFMAREGERLTFTAYGQLGGLEGAIGRAAEQAFGSLHATAQGALPRLLRGLAEASGRGVGLTLRDLPLSAASEGTPLRTLVDALVTARILLIHGEAQGAMLRLAHEAVLRGWERAHELTTKEKDFYRIRAYVAAAEQRWHAQRRSDLLLAPGLPLAEAQWLKASYGAELAPELIAFVDASTAKERSRQRRAYALAAVFGVVAIAAIVAGFYAKKQAALAERNFNAAKSTIDAVIFDLAVGLRDVEGMRAETVRRILTRAEAAVGQLAISTESDPAILRSLRGMFDQFSETYSRLGDTMLALDYAQKATGVARQLSAKEPGNAIWRRDVAASLTRVGDVLVARGDLLGALAVYREGLQIRRELAARGGDDTDWQRDLSESFKKIGDIARARGDLAVALSAYREELDIARELSAKDPSNVIGRRDLSIGLEKVGDVLRDRGDLNGALAAYREDLKIARELAAKDLSNTQWQFDVSVCLDRIGSVLRDQGNLDDALVAHREALAIRRPLSVMDSSNEQWRRAVGISLINIGDVLENQGDLPGALAAFREGLGIAQELAGKDPLNAQWRSDVSLSLQRVVGVLREQGDLSGALAAFSKGLDLARALAATDPNNAQWQRDLSVSLERVGEVLQDEMLLTRALAAYRESLEIMRALTAKDAANTGWRYDVSLSLERVGDVLTAQGDRLGALAAYREGLAIRRALAAMDPANTEWQTSVVLLLWRLAPADEDPRARWSEALAILTQLKSQGRLTPAQQEWIGTIEGEIAGLPQPLPQ
ncbi:MAG: tetratricopeptide repeat protein [Hyphomicrobiales bacterium]